MSDDESQPAPSEGEEADAEAPSFEEELRALERSVSELESGRLPLEEAIRRYESGFHAMKRCYSLLEGAQKRVEILSSELGQQEAAWKSLEGNDLLREPGGDLEAESDTSRDGS